jgi:hypothetical protein
MHGGHYESSGKLGALLSVRYKCEALLCSLDDGNAYYGQSKAKRLSVNRYGVHANIRVLTYLHVQHCSIAALQHCSIAALRHYDFITV